MTIKSFRIFILKLVKKLLWNFDKKKKRMGFRLALCCIILIFSYFGKGILCDDLVQTIERDSNLNEEFEKANMNLINKKIPKEFIDVLVTDDLTNQVKSIFEERLATLILQGTPENQKMVSTFKVALEGLDSKSLKNILKNLQISLKP
ncbi:UNVERIFIED_CONTAM: hypothetical protein RMT77_005855 [Armadillidium vulgare]